jgi:drug/metabolite transporter (DMT)-like permease
MRCRSEISLSRHTIVRVLAGTTSLLLVASVAGQLTQYLLGNNQIHELIRLFYVDLEGNIPTLFSSSILLFASLLLALISALAKRSHDTRWRQWAVLSLALLYMAVDEASRIHEVLNRPAKSLLGQHASGIFFHTWVIFGISLVLIFAVSYLKFFFSLPLRTRIQFFAAAATFFGGAVGMEMIGGYYAESHGKDDFQYSMLATVEEGLEMAGVLMLINALLNYLIDHYDVRLRLDSFRESS